MAKIRRIVRKLAPAGRSFDEQLWPVYLALLVLGGLLFGGAIGSLEWGDLWQRLLLVFSLLLIPFLTGMAMMVLALMDSRKLNRRTLLSLVLALISTFAFFTGSKFIDAIRYIQVSLTSGAEQTEKPRKIIPEYHEFQINPQDKPKQDFQKPVETKEVEPEPEEVKRQETEPEEAKPKPEKVEVTEPKEEVEPNAVERKIVEQTAPRRSEQQAKLSRQTTEFKPSAATPAATVKVDASQQKVDVQAKSTEVARQANQAQSTKADSPTEPTTKTEAQEVEITRRQTSSEQVAKSTSAPTLPRKIEQPKAIPRTNAVAEAVSAPVPQQTSPSEVKPNTTAAQKQQTTSTEVAQRPTEPTPDTPTKIADTKPLARQQTPARMPDLAQSARSQPNRRVPTITVPQTSAVAAAEPTTTTSTQPTPREAIKPSEATVARTQTSAPTPSRAPQPTDAPQPSRPLEIAQANNQRAQSSEVPTANPQATPTRSVSRTAAQSAAEVPVQAQAVQVAAAQPVESTNSPRPAGVSASKQQTSTSAVARATSNPSPEVPTAVTEVSSTPQTRQQAAQPSPVMAQTNSPVLARLAPATSNPSPTAVAATVTTPTESPVKSDSPSPAPSASTVARQTSQTTANSSSPRAMETPTQSPSTELARAQTSRATTADVPTIHPNSRPTNAPARSANTADLAASPVAKAAPAAATSERPTSNPAAEPARTALTRAAYSGTAGVGHMKNMDRNSPAPDNSPAAVASGSARRAQATQQMESGPALAPSAPAQVARSRAGASAPSATLLAEELENATVAGAQQAAELDASASAAIERQAADAVAGDVTASAGEIEVDFGPTKIVSENSTGKAAGGGQPTLNFETRSNQIHRANAGGAMQLALAEAKVEPVAQAEAGTGGGEPATPEASPEATAVVRTEAGGASPATGGPAAMTADPSTESASSQQVAEAKIGRAESIEAAKAEPTPGGGSSSPARNATGPKLEANLIASAAQPTDAANPPQGAPDGSPPKPSEVQVARADASGGAPTSGGPSKADAVGPTEEEDGEPSKVELALAQSSVGRASAIEATTGQPKAGGGTSSPTRQATGPAFTTSAKAEQIALAGSPASSGISQGSPIEAQGSDAVRAAAGIAGKASGQPAGALAAAEVMDAPATGEPGDTPGSGRAKLQAADGPQVGGELASAGPLKKSTKFQPPGGSAEQIAMADAGGGSPSGQPDVEAMMSGMDSAGMSRQVAGGLPVEVSAPEGPGGLGTEVALDAGTMNRRSQAESQEVHFREARFVRTQTGGPLSINLAADLGTKAFSGRSRFKNKDLTGEGGEGTPPPKTEKAIELGLQFLANHQSNDGSWSLGDFGAGRRGYEGERTALQSDAAATGLCLLTFLGAGYHHQDDRYKEVVASGIDYLVKNQKANGDLYVNQDPKSGRSVWLYTHGICAIALCEAYGMTQDPDLREPAQKALDFIAASQNEDYGGWRYSPGNGSDTSVTGWMMMALKSGELAGLDVKPETFTRIDKWLNAAQSSKSDRHLYSYNPLAPNTPEQRHGRDITKTMTSVGLLMRLYSGWKRDNEHMQAGARYLVRNLPTDGTRLNPERDTYYWYYATQVMFHMGGEYWEAWNERLHPLLTDSQVVSGPMAGSWDPRFPVRDRWAGEPLPGDTNGPVMAGRIYLTTLNLLSLEVYYRHLPIYEDTAK